MDRICISISRDGKITSGDLVKGDAIKRYKPFGFFVIFPLGACERVRCASLQNNKPPQAGVYIS
jgi:hypothetical protein